jgi:hypothetical protein
MAIYQLKLIGWRVGFQTISFVHALREHCGYGLRDAKDVVDRLLDGEILVVNPTTDADRVALLEKAQLLGVRVETTP